MFCLEIILFTVYEYYIQTLVPTNIFVLKPSGPFITFPTKTNVIYPSLNEIVSLFHSWEIYAKAYEYSE